MDTNRVVGALLLLGVVGIVGSSVPVAYPQQKSIPERPADLSEPTVKTYAHDFERAYTWNREVEGWFNPVTVNIQRTNVTRRTTGYRIHLEVGFSERTLQSSGGGFYTVNYFVNQSATMRAEAGGQHRPGPDPHNGTLVSRADS